MYLTMLKKYKVLSKVLEQTSIHKIESTIYLLCDCCTRLHDQFIGKYPNYNFTKKTQKQTWCFLNVVNTYVFYIFFYQLYTKFWHFHVSRKNRSWHFFNVITTYILNIFFVSSMQRLDVFHIPNNNVLDIFYMSWKSIFLIFNKCQSSLALTFIQSRDNDFKYIFKNVKYNDFFTVRKRRESVFVVI